MINLNKLTDHELRERAKSLNNTFRTLHKIGDQDGVEKVRAELDLIHQEREDRYMKQYSPEKWKP